MAKDAAKKGEEVTEIVPDLKIKMNKDGSFIGYLKWVLTLPVCLWLMRNNNLK